MIPRSKKIILSGRTIRFGSLLVVVSALSGVLGASSPADGLAVPILAQAAEISETPSSSHDLTGVDAIRSNLDALIEQCPGTPSIVIASAQEGWAVERRASEVIRAASVIKLPIMAAIFAMKDRGEVDLSESIALRAEDRTGGSGNLENAPLHRTYTLEQLIERMIIESDNTATNALLRRFGIDVIEREFMSMGLSQTRLIHRILGSREDNPTTANEMASLLERLFSRTGNVPAHGRPESADAMRRLLIKVVNRGRLGRYLPEQVNLAHKTGTMRNIVHDVGIIETSRGDIVITALITNSSDHSTAEKWLGRLGKMVYEHIDADAAGS